MSGVVDRSRLPLQLSCAVALAGACVVIGTIAVITRWGNSCFGWVAWWRTWATAGSRGGMPVLAA